MDEGKEQKPAEIRSFSWVQPAILNRFQYIYIYIYGKINGDHHHHLSTVQNNEDLKTPASFVKQPGCAFEKISNKHSEF
jgi:hypothetical protein